MSWAEFWERQHRIYVSDRHLAAHYRRIGEDLVPLLDRQGLRVLDWGCGDALATETLLRHGASVDLYDASAAVRERLAARFGGTAGVAVLAAPDRDGGPAGGPAGSPGGGYDLVLVNSVLQYLTRTELDRLLPRLRDALAPNGRLVLADVIPPGAGLLSDVWYLLWPGLRHGYVLAGLAGLAASLLGDYRKLRKDLGLARYGEAELLALLRTHGLDGERQPRNIGFNQARMTVVASRSRGA